MAAVGALRDVSDVSSGEQERASCLDRVLPTSGVPCAADLRRCGGPARAEVAFKRRSVAAMEVMG